MSLEFGGGWAKHTDGYYYYYKSLSPEEKTYNLITQVSFNNIFGEYGLCVSTGANTMQCSEGGEYGNGQYSLTVTFEVIQSDAYESEWNVSPTNLPQPVIVNFDANGGIVDVASKVVNYNKTYGTLPTPTREGYTFNGWSKNLYDFGTASDYYVPRNNMTFNTNQRSITVIKADGWAGDFWRNEKNVFLSGTYSISAMFSGDTGTRHIIYPYDANGNLLNDTAINIPGFAWNSYYGGWIITINNFTVSIPSTVAYWKYGSSFSGDANKEASIYNIQIEKTNAVTTYEPFNIINSNTVVNTTSNHTLTANWTLNN